VNPLDPTAPPVPARRRTKPVVWIAAALILLVLIAGTVGSLAAQEQSTPKPSRTGKSTSDTPQQTYRFTSCNDVWAGGQGPFKKGEPGYTQQLDPDGDGVACESKPKG
jgi:hypothetical protein